MEFSQEDEDFRSAVELTTAKAFSEEALATASEGSSNGSNPSQWGVNFIVEDEKLVYAEFMRAHKCYDLIPISSKLVVFDTQLLVKKAFFALVYNGVRAAPLWDSGKQEFVGMLTITDFINILRKYHLSPLGINQQLEENKIANWKGEAKPDKQRPLISIDVNASLYAAIQALCDDQVHRLPVMDFTTGNILYILTHKRILRFLCLYINDLPEPDYMKKTPKQLGIGTWDNILTVRQDTRLVDALNKFVEKRVSALPVVNAEGVVIDIYAKFDVINLAAEKAYSNLNITVKEALSHRMDWFEGVLSCDEDDSLRTLTETIVKAEVHRILICDKAKRVKGIVSLSDLLRFLVLSTHTEEPMDTS